MVTFGGFPRVSYRTCLACLIGKGGSRLIALRNDNDKDGSIQICSGGSRREGLLHSTAYSGTIVNQRLTITNGQRLRQVSKSGIRA